VILIDTNIWAYYFDATLDEHTHVIKPVETALRQHSAAVNSTIVIETLHYLVRRLGPLAGGDKCHVFLNYGIPLYILDAQGLELTRQKLCELSHLGIGGRDASLLATMTQQELQEIMTHDQAFKRVPDIRVIDPIGKAR
jgi:predicted nucleic acid-binding protein